MGQLRFVEGFEHYSRAAHLLGALYSYLLWTYAHEDEDNIVSGRLEGGYGFRLSGGNTPEKGGLHALLISATPPLFGVMGFAARMQGDGSDNAGFVLEFYNTAEPDVPKLFLHFEATTGAIAHTFGRTEEDILPVESWFYVEVGIGMEEGGKSLFVRVNEFDVISILDTQYAGTPGINAFRFKPLNENGLGGVIDDMYFHDIAPDSFLGESAVFPIRATRSADVTWQAVPPDGGPATAISGRLTARTLNDSYTYTHPGSSRDLYSGSSLPLWIRKIHGLQFKASVLKLQDSGTFYFRFLTSLSDDKSTPDYLLPLYPVEAGQDYWTYNETLQLNFMADRPWAPADLESRAIYFGYASDASGVNEVRVDALTIEVLCSVTDLVPFDPGPVPAWTVKPTWEPGVVERLAWKTDVLESQTGVEQRRMLRVSPRRSIEATYKIWAKSRRLLDYQFTGNRLGLWRMPLWWEKRNLILPAKENDTEIRVDARYGEFLPNQVIMFLGDGPLDFELAVVKQAQFDRLFLKTRLTKNWPVWTHLYPTKLGQFVDSQAPTRRGPNAYEVALQFQILEPNDYYGKLPDLILEAVPFAPLFLTRPNEVDDLTHTYQRLLAEFDNETGIPIRRDLARSVFNLFQHTHMTVGREAFYEYKGFLYGLAGKLRAVYVPTHMHDLRWLPGYETEEGDTFLYVERSGYADNLDPSTRGRRYILIRLKNGETFVRTITEARNVDERAEILDIDLPLTAIREDMVACVSFVELMRQDQDELEIMHHTATDGTTTFKTTFRGVDASRVADSYSIPGSYFNGNPDKGPGDPEPVLDVISPPKMRLAHVEDNKEALANLAKMRTLLGITNR